MFTIKIHLPATVRQIIVQIKLDKSMINYTVGKNAKRIKVFLKKGFSRDHYVLL